MHNLWRVLSEYRVVDPVLCTIRQVNSFAVLDLPQNTSGNNIIWQKRRSLPHVRPSQYYLFISDLHFGERHKAYATGNCLKDLNDE
jgi:hypothetical protein